MRASTVRSRFLDRCGDSFGVEKNMRVLLLQVQQVQRVFLALTLTLTLSRWSRCSGSSASSTPMAQAPSMPRYTGIVNQYRRTEGTEPHAYLLISTHLLVNFTMALSRSSTSPCGHSACRPARRRLAAWARSMTR